MLGAVANMLSTILWPSPRAWAGLAAVWIAILTVSLSAGHSTSSVRKASLAPAPDVAKAFKEQERLLVELIGNPYAPETKTTERPFRRNDPTSLPRSERREESAGVQLRNV
jgi:hypothetical protein